MMDTPARVEGREPLIKTTITQMMAVSPNNPVSPSVQAAGWSALPESYRIPEAAPSLAEAQAYCERLAKTHYENFSVATWFLPSRLRQHFYNVYAYCRISDDLGDEVGNAQQSLELLDLWEAELNACYAGSHPSTPTPGVPGTPTSYPSTPTPGVPGTPTSPRHPVFVALAETIKQCGIPRHEFSDLLIAFRQDQTITRFPTFDDVLAYCRYSANPVGHLVLYLCGYSDAQRQQLSDYTCTALQLANFWQDVTVDYGKGRIYLPLESLRRFGVTEDDLAQRRATPQFVELMKFEVQRAREWFDRGLPLIKMVNKELAIDLELFSHGGQEILNAIERQGYDVLRQRPVISKSRKLLLVARAAAGKLL
jgi:squalene synthase HpnC